MRVLVAGVEALGLKLSESQVGQFARYQLLLLAWNERLNLTAITEPEGVQARLFLDSLSCALAMGDLDGQRVIDVGTGAGFPGLPLKLLYPGMALTLVESVGKKARFLEAVVAELGLDGVKVLVDRAEQVGREEAHRGIYDWAMARAVAAMPVVAEYLMPLCRMGGRMLAQKGAEAGKETADAAGAIEELGGGQAVVQRVVVPGLDEKRFLVVVEKVRETPERYPRRVGVPGKRPL
jgi:16S rRNA (guanine527-N7)-methyltransferase